MYVCMYACMYVCMYVRMYVCMYVSMWVLVYACMYTYVHVCIYLYITYVSYSAFITHTTMISIYTFWNVLCVGTNLADTGLWNDWLFFPPAF